MGLKDKRASFQFTLLGVVSLLLVATTFTSTLYSYHRNSLTILDTAQLMVEQSTDRLIDKSSSYLQPADHLTHLFSEITTGTTEELLKNARIPHLLENALETYAHISNVYIANQDGTMIMAHRKTDGLLSTKYIWSDKGKMHERWVNRGADGAVAKTEAVETTYDPRSREWFKSAQSRKSIVWTKPYVFHSSQKRGITASLGITRGTTSMIMGVDFTLDGLSSFADGLAMGETGSVLLFDDNMNAVAIPSTLKSTLVETSFKEDIKKTAAFPEQAAFQTHVARNESTFNFDFEGNEYLTTVKAFSTPFIKDWTIVVTVKRAELLHELKQAQGVSLLLSLIVLLVGLGLAYVVAKSISNSVHKLTTETNRIKNFDLTGSLDTGNSRISEIKDMTDAVESMKNGLRAFRKYVPAPLVQDLISSGKGVRLGGEDKDLTIFFSDIVNFTTIAEELPAQDMMLQLSVYFTEIAAIISDEGGVVDKYIGDSVMAFWGAPKDNPQHAQCAVRAALRVQERLKELNEYWAKDGKPALETRIGLHTGAAIVGNVGSEERMNYTLLGDSVNLASRIEGVNKFFGSRVLVSEETYAATSSDILYRPLGTIRVQGVSLPHDVYEPMGPCASGEGKTSDINVEQFISGLDAFKSGDWAKAQAEFQACLDKGDDVAEVYLKLSQTYAASGSPENWEGILTIGK